MSGTQEEIPPGLADILTRQDELIAQTNSLLRRQNQLTESVVEAFERAGLDIIEGQPRSVQLEMSRLVTAGADDSSPETEDRKVPFDGQIVTYTVGWPDGADNAVGVQLELDDRKIFPFNSEDQYVAANDFTHPFDLVEPVEQDQTLTSEYINNDATNDHFINSIVTIMEAL